MIPFMDLNAQYQSIKKEMDETIRGVIRSYKFINGPDVEVFEKEFAKKQEVRYCVGTSSGTSALHLAFELIGLQPGDEVIVTSMTFIATTEPLRQLGAIPVFIDINPKSYNMDEKKIEDAVTAKTKAIIAVHLHGNPCEMQRIKTIAEKYNLKIVEDCAQAHLAEYQGTKVGNFGDVSTFSFYPGKNLGAYGDAGALAMNDESYYTHAKQLVNHGRSEKYLHEVEGYNYRLDTLQAAILNVKLKYLDQWTDLRINHAKLYLTILGDSEISLPELSEDKKHVFHIFSIAAKNRDKIQGLLKQHAIETGIHYPVPLHLQPAYRHLNYKKGDLAASENLANEFLSLPLYPEMKADDIERICQLIKQADKES
jgi:dTDP-4-amino-4,6-dideoxygalactose transaminase